MADDDREKWDRLPNVNFDSKKIKKRLRVVSGVTVRHANKFLIGRWSSVREAQRHITLWILAMGIIIAATGFQLMWYQKNYRSTAPATNGTYAEAVLGPVNTLNPLFADSSAEQSAGYLLFSRLLNYDKTGHLSYDIAKSIKVDETNTIYTVNIRPDVFWHDGSKLTANDIAFTIGLIKNSTLRSTIKGWDDVTEKVINETTIEFSIKSVYAGFEHLLTFAILPQHILGEVQPVNVRENEFSQNPIGSGPFQLSFVQDIDSISKKKVIYMVRNQDYYGGTPKLEKFQLHVFESTDAIIRALQINEVNAVADLSPVDMNQVNTKKYDVSYSPIQSGVYAILNTTSETLKDINVRKALQMATNTPDIRKLLVANSPALDLPLTNSQLNGDLPTALPFNLIEASKYLQDNGWALNNNGIREKDSKPLKLSIVVIKDSELEKVLEKIIEQWRRLGIEIETKIVDTTDISQNIVQNVLQPRLFDVLIQRLNIGADPDVYAYWHSSQATKTGVNYSNYSNPVSDDALETARARVEPDLRNAKYITFAKQWLEDVPAIGLYQSTSQYVKVKEVNAFNKSNVLISSIDRYSDILDWSVGTKDVYKTP